MLTETVINEVRELFDDQFSATFGSGRGTGQSPENAAVESPLPDTNFSVNLPRGGGGTYVVVFPDGRFLRRDNDTGRSYPNSFANCSYFGTAVAAQKALDRCMSHSPSLNGTDLSETNRENAVIKKVVAVNLVLQDVGE